MIGHFYLAWWLQSLWVWNVAKLILSLQSLPQRGTSVLQLPLTEADASLFGCSLDTPSSAPKNLAFPSSLLLLVSIQAALGRAQDNSTPSCLVLNKLSHTSFVLVTSSERTGHPNAAPLWGCHSLL